MSSGVKRKGNSMKVKLGILRDKTMADEFMYIPSDDTQNYSPFVD